jgi:hypothetical protein
MEEAKFSFNVKFLVNGYECCFTMREDAPDQAPELVNPPKAQRLPESQPQPNQQRRQCPRLLSNRRTPFLIMCRLNPLTPSLNQPPQLRRSRSSHRQPVRWSARSVASPIRSSLSTS